VKQTCSKNKVCEVREGIVGSRKRIEKLVEERYLLGQYKIEVRR